MEHLDSFIAKPVLTPEYGTLFDHQSFLMQGLHRMYLIVELKLQKGMAHIRNPLPLPNCYYWGWIKLSHYVVSNMHSDPLQELVNKDLCILLEAHKKIYLSTVRWKSTTFL